MNAQLPDVRSTDAHAMHGPGTQGGAGTQTPDFLPRTVGRAARFVSAAAGGVAFGVLTLWMQGHFDGNWNVLANSGAVWTIVAVALAAALGRSVIGSAVVGLVTLLGEVAGYYWCAAPWHGIAVTQSEQILWAGAAVVLGPLAGLIGFGVARGTAAQRVFALLSVAGVTAGEGWYQLHLLQHAVAGQVEIGLGLLVAAAGLLMIRTSSTTRLAALAFGALVAGAITLAYSAPTLVL